MVNSGLYDKKYLLTFFQVGRMMKSSIGKCSLTLWYADVLHLDRLRQS